MVTNDLVERIARAIGVDVYGIKMVLDALRPGDLLPNDNLVLDPVDQSKLADWLWKESARRSAAQERERLKAAIDAVTRYYDPQDLSVKVKDLDAAIRTLPLDPDT